MRTLASCKRPALAERITPRLPREGTTRPGEQDRREAIKDKKPDAYLYSYPVYYMDHVLAPTTNPCADILQDLGTLCRPPPPAAPYAERLLMLANHLLHPRNGLV